MEFIPIVVLLAMVKSFVDLVKRAMAKEYKPVATQVLSYVMGVLVTLLFSKTAYAATLVFGGVSLATAGLATVVVIGIAIAASAGLAVDALDAVKARNEAHDASVRTKDGDPTT